MIFPPKTSFSTYKQLIYQQIYQLKFHYLDFVVQRKELRVIPWLIADFISVFWMVGKWKILFIHQ